jgi:hypothetical protein
VYQYNEINVMQTLFNVLRIKGLYMFRVLLDYPQEELHNGALYILMFVPCIIRRSRNNQQYALILTTPLFYILAPTCFGSSLPSSGGFLDPSELLEIQIEWVVHHIMCGYVACVPDCRGSVCCASHIPLPEDPS